jgi:2-polyprenyl-6-methoxyphenol hydroxylase-like FAD-dependent oxidoreductase
MTSSTMDALIVGAGPVGLTMATALTHQGLKCRVIDKAAAPSDKSKALVVWSRSLELLDQFDLANTFVQTGMKIRGASIYGQGKRLVHLEVNPVDSPFGFPLMIPQNETERLLTEHLVRHGVTVERQVELVTFEERADGVQGTLRRADGTEENFETPWLIGCDGAHSTVRHTLGMEFTGEAEPNDWILADVHVQGPIANDEMSIYWHEKGVVVFFPITTDRYRMIADLGAAKNTSSPPTPSLADAQAKVDERGPGGLTLCEPIWLAGFRINERKVTDYRRGRVMLAGDAAHIHSPAGGQGMNTGMQDAFNLAWKLALVHKGHGQEEPLLASYSHERSAVGDQVLRGAGMMTLVATMRNPVAQFVRNHAASALTSFEFVRDKMQNALCELSINYRHSALSIDEAMIHRGIHAGDRLPDAPLLRLPTKEATSLFTAIRGYKHALLLVVEGDDPDMIAQSIQTIGAARAAFPGLLSGHLLTGAAVESAAFGAARDDVSVLVDVEGTALERLGAGGGTLFVIRPDGYIGYRGDSAQVASALAYLDRYLVRRG